MTLPRWFWPAVIATSAVTVAALDFGGLSSPVRPILAIWFLIACPGMALVRLLGLENAWAELALAPAVSLSLDAIVGLGLIYGGDWSPKLGLAVLIGISLVGAALQLRLPLRPVTSRPAESASE